MPIPTKAEFDVLGLLSRAKWQRPVDLVRRSNDTLPVGSVYTLLVRLGGKGLVERDDTGRYRRSVAGQQVLEACRD